METTVTQSQIDFIMSKCKFTEMDKLFDKCYILACQLPCGFVIVESSACVDPKNYDKEIGKSECLKKIESKIWELEGFFLNKVLEGMLNGSIGMQERETQHDKAE